MKLYGLHRVSYTSKKDNQVKSGWQLFIGDDTSSPSSGSIEPGKTFGVGFYNVKGQIPYVSDSIAEKCKLAPSCIGKSISISYNAYGSIDSLIFS